MRNVHTLPCGFTEDLLIAEVLGDISSELSRHVAGHLDTCPSCQKLREGYRRLHTHLQALSAVEQDDQGLKAARQRLDKQLARGARPKLQLEIWHSPVGDIRLGATEKGVALVEFIRPEETKFPPPGWSSDFHLESGGPEITALIARLEDYFSGKIQSLDWLVDEVLMRSDFQRAVLRATAEVPYGTVVTYQGIAEAIGQPRAVRAVAQALRHNPVPIHIPCHRVIGRDGALTGYAGNLVDIKRKILQVEGVPVIETEKGLAIPKARMYVGWRRDRWVCRPTCPSLKDQSAGDRAFIPSLARAEAMGYQACDVCRPDVYPLSLL